MPTYLDLERWPRRAHFDLFRGYDHPFFNLCAPVEVTALRAATGGAGGRSFFLAALWLSLAAANAIEPFRYRLRGDRVLVHEVIHGSGTILRPDGTFGFAYFEFDPAYGRFHERAAREVERVRASTALEPVAYAAYLAPSVLLALAAGLAFSLVLGAVRAMLVAADRATPRVPARGVAVAAVATLFLGAALSVASWLFPHVLEEPLLEVVRKVNLRVASIPFAVRHFSYLFVAGVFAVASHQQPDAHVVQDAGAPGMAVQDALVVFQGDLDSPLPSQRDIAGVQAAKRTPIEGVPVRAIPLQHGEGHPQHTRDVPKHHFPGVGTHAAGELQQE